MNSDHWSVKLSSVYPDWQFVFKISKSLANSDSNLFPTLHAGMDLL